MDFYLISVLIFIAIIALILFKDRKNVERQLIFFIRKTQHGKSTIIRIGESFPRFWKVVSTIGVIVGFFMSIYIVFLLVSLLVEAVITSYLPGPALSFLLPVPSTEVIQVPGLILIPFWYFIISIALLVVVHEGLHGIIAASEKIGLKSLGWGLLAIIPVAFVEPDEKQMAKKPAISQLRVFAAGSFANFILAFLCLFIISFGLVSMTTSTGVGYSYVAEGYPAEMANMTGKIISIDGFEIHNSNDLAQALINSGPNQTVTVTTVSGDGDESEFIIKTSQKPPPQYSPTFVDDLVAGIDTALPGTVEFSKSFGDGLSSIGGSQYSERDSLMIDIQYWQYLSENYPHLEERAESHIEEIEMELQETPESGYLGILNVYDVREARSQFLAFESLIFVLIDLLSFVALINFGVGAFNLLPIYALDGGRMWHILLLRFAPKRAKPVTKILTYITLLIIASIFIIQFLF